MLTKLLTKESAVTVHIVCYRSSKIVLKILNKEICIMGLYNNRIVVKVGTSTLTNDAGKSDLRTTDRLVCVLSAASLTMFSETE